MDVRLNGAPLPPTAFDSEGNFAHPVPLLEGTNNLHLVVRSADEVVAAATKSVRFNPNLSTSGKRLLYVHVVDLGAETPSLSGTLVLDLDSDTLLGLIEDQHVAGISPNGREIYMTDRTVIGTDRHRSLRTLAFTVSIPLNGFLVSPDGTRIYSRGERLDVASNSLLAPLPQEVTTGSSWAQAPIPGGPVISADGRQIYCCNPTHLVQAQADCL